MDAQGWDERYAATPLVWSAGPNALFAQLVGELGAGSPAGRALDVACGEGRMALWLAARGWVVRAVDFSPVAIAKGRQRAQHEGLDVDWVVADVTATDFGDGAHDLVALLYLHLDAAAMQAVLRGCVRALTPGGTLVVIAHDRDNIEQGVGGPQDPAILPTADLLREWACGVVDDLVVERCEQVERQTEQGAAIDVLLLASRSG